MRTRAVAALTGGVLVLAGCQSGYESAEDLAEDVGCSQVVDDDQPGAHSAVECAYGPDEESLWVATFDDDEAFEQYLNRRAARVQFTVHGDDWAVTGPEPIVGEVQRDIGGSLLSESR